jgi:hypothetical protein
MSATRSARTVRLVDAGNVDAERLCARGDDQDVGLLSLHGVRRDGSAELHLHALDCHAFLEAFDQIVELRLPRRHAGQADLASEAILLLVERDLMAALRRRDGELHACRASSRDQDTL